MNAMNPTERSFYPLTLPAEARGVVSRPVRTVVAYEARRGSVQEMSVTVPAGIPVVKVHGLWFAVDLQWLRDYVAGPPELLSTSVVYHGATQFGVMIDETHVKSA